MGRLRGWIRRLERESRGEMIIIPQQDGTVAKFKPSELREAFEMSYKQLCDETTEVHPLSLAAMNSSDAQWRESVFVGVHALADDFDGDIADVPDLSEQPAEE